MGVFASFIRKAVRKAIDEKLPRLVDEAMRDSFSRKPNATLTELGFRWAWVLRIRHHWPDVPNREAARWLDDYMPAEFGHADYSWTVAAANELADEYVAEFGE